MKKVYLITGSIGAGKSTYAKKRAKENDVIFDLDELNKAMGGKLHEDKSKRLSVLLKMREAAFDAIADRSGEWENAYVITASSDREKVNELLRKLGAEEVRIETDLEECKERILNDDSRPDKEREIGLTKNWHKSTREQFAEWFNNTF